MLNREQMLSIRANPCKESVEAVGGSWVGAFSWPMTADDVAAMKSATLPKGHILCEALVGKTATFYTVPWEFRRDAGKDVKVESYDNRRTA